MTWVIIKFCDYGSRFCSQRDDSYDGFFPQESITVKAIGIFARTVPTAQDLKVDVIKNGTAQNNLGNLTSGIQFEKTVLSSSI
jgi:hypothetical protein